ncbi:hypothetical protein BDW72DRAFT_208952 [Aspergillus terricola var. indicus]
MQDPVAITITWALFELARHPEVAQRLREEVVCAEFIPFNHGPRICLGRMFGYFQMEYTLCRIFQHFERVELHEPRVQRIKDFRNNEEVCWLIIGCPPACALDIDPTRILGFPTKRKSPLFLSLPLSSPSTNTIADTPVVGDMVWTPDFAQLQRLSPAVTAIDAFLDSRSNQSHRLVVHAFSNAGSHAAVQLAEAYTAVHPSASLPVTGLILDSCPGAPSAILSANAMILALPKSSLIRLLGAALIYSVVATVALLDFLRLYQNVISKTRHVLNSQSGCFLRRGVRRVYLYSRTDAMVPWTDILDHAGEARRLAESGDDLVQTVEFTGSGHVGHLAVAREEYIKAVLPVVTSKW